MIADSNNYSPILLKMMETLKLLLRLYYRPAATMSEIIDRGSWLLAAVLMLIVSFAFQYAVNSRVAEIYAVSKMDFYLANSNFNDENFDGGRLTAAQIEEAEYLANVDIENEMKRERAREMFGQAMESAKNSPYYRRREQQYWRKLAQKEI